MKTCTWCRTEKQANEFGSDKSRSDGRFPWCIDCKRSYQTSRYVKKRTWTNHEESFWLRVDRSNPDGCWPWLGEASYHGYARVTLGGVKRQAHRWAYEFLVGNVPDGLELDHLCRNRRCCKPAHLEPVTHRENIIRGDTIPSTNLRKTHCPRGHPYDAENTRYGSSQRLCRQCQRVHNTRYKARKRAERMAS